MVGTGQIGCLEREAWRTRNGYFKKGGGGYKKHNLFFFFKVSTMWFHRGDTFPVANQILETAWFRFIQQWFSNSILVEHLIWKVTLSGPWLYLVNMIFSQFTEKRTNKKKILFPFKIFLPYLFFFKAFLDFPVSSYISKWIGGNKWKNADMVLGFET